MLFLMQGIPWFLVLLIISTFSLGTKKFSFHITFSCGLAVKKSRHYYNDFSLSRILTFISTFILFKCNEQLLHTNCRTFTCGLSHLSCQQRGLERFKTWEPQELELFKNLFLLALKLTTYFGVRKENI